MANIGLRYPYIAKFNKSTGAYSDGFKCGKAVQVNVTPNYSEASLYGDDELAEYDKAFIDANVTLGTTTMPAAAAETVFGHTIDSTTHQVSYKATDSPNPVGVGFVSVEIENGSRSYSANIIVNVTFSESAVDYTTKGDSLQFSTPSIEGKAGTNASGEWKIVKLFDTPSAAEDFVKSTLNIASDNQGD